MKVSTKFLAFVFLFASCGLLQASNTITNNTGQSIQFATQFTVVQNGIGGQGVALSNNQAYTLTGQEDGIVSVCVPLQSNQYPAPCNSSFMQISKATITPNTSYDLILGSGNKILLLLSMGSGSKFIPKPGK